MQFKENSFCPFKIFVSINPDKSSCLKKQEITLMRVVSLLVADVFAVVRRQFPVIDDAGVEPSPYLFPTAFQCRDFAHIGEARRKMKFVAYLFCLVLLTSLTGK